MKRRVSVFEYTRPKDAKYDEPYSKTLVGIGEFQQYGSDYEEFESGPGNFTTAIVEMPDGTVVNVAVDLIQFMDIT